MKKIILLTLMVLVVVSSAMALQTKPVSISDGQDTYRYVYVRDDPIGADGWYLIGKDNSVSPVSEIAEDLGGHDDLVSSLVDKNFEDGVIQIQRNNPGVVMYNDRLVDNNAIAAVLWGKDNQPASIRSITGTGDTRTATSKSSTVQQSTIAYNEANERGTFTVTTGRGNVYTYEEDPNNKGIYRCAFKGTGAPCGTYKLNNNNQFECVGGDCRTGSLSTFNTVQGVDNAFAYAKSQSDTIVTQPEEPATEPNLDGEPAEPSTPSSQSPTSFNDPRIEIKTAGNTTSVNMYYVNARTGSLERAKLAGDFEGYTMSKEVFDKLGVGEDISYDQLANLLSDPNIDIQNLKPSQITTDASGNIQISKFDDQGKPAGTVDVNVNNGAYTIKSTTTEDGKQVERTVQYRTDGLIEHGGDIVAGNGKAYTRTGQLALYNDLAIPPGGYDQTTQNRINDLTSTANSLTSTIDNTNKEIENLAKASADIQQQIAALANAPGAAEQEQRQQLQKDLEDNKAKQDELNKKNDKDKADLKKAQQDLTQTQENGKVTRPIDLRKVNVSNIFSTGTQSGLWAADDYCEKQGLTGGSLDNCIANINDNYLRQEGGTFFTGEFGRSFRRDHPSLTRGIILTRAITDKLSAGASAMQAGATAGAKLWSFFPGTDEEPLWDVGDTEFGQFAQRYLDNDNIRAEACRHWLNQGSGEIGVVDPSRPHLRGDILFLDDNRDTIGAYVVAERSSFIDVPGERRNQTKQYFYKINYKISAIKGKIEYNINLCSGDAEDCKKGTGVVVEGLFPEEVKLKKGETEDRSGAQTLTKYSDRSYGSVCVAVSKGFKNFRFTDSDEGAFCANIAESSGGMQAYEFKDPSDDPNGAGVWPFYAPDEYEDSTADDDEDDSDDDSGSDDSSEEDTRYQDPGSW